MLDDEDCRDTVEIPADPMADMNTKDNDLSLWVVTDDHSNLDRIVAALAATRDTVANFDFALIDVTEVDACVFALQKSDGGSKDSEANSLWHRDVKRLSGHRLLRLTEVFFRTAEVMRYNDRRVLKLLKQYVNSGHILQSELKERIRDKISVS